MGPLSFFSQLRILKKRINIKVIFAFISDKASVNILMSLPIKGLRLFLLTANGTHIASNGLRSTDLAGYTNLSASCKASNTHKPRFWLYAMLAVVQILLQYFPKYFVKLIWLLKMWEMPTPFYCYDFCLRQQFFYLINRLCWYYILP